MENIKRIEISWNYELVKKYVESLGYILISDTYKNCNIHLILTDKFKYIYSISLSNLLQGNIPPKFHTANPYTLQNIKIWSNLNNQPFELISEIYNGNNKHLLFQDKYGYIYSISLQNLLKYKTPDKFNISNPYTIQNINLWSRLNDKLFELVDGQTYNKSHEKLKWKCLKEECGEIFKSNWNDIREGNGCPFCAGKQLGLSNCLATKNPELAKEWHPTLNGNLTPYDVNYKSVISVYWQCKENPLHIWKTSIHSRSSKLRCGCTICNESKGEKQLSIILNYKNILYIPQHAFSGCKNINVLKFDFYLPNYNTCIEFQGRQHYEPVDFFGGKKQLKLQQKLDQIKRDYCMNNNIKLIEIAYLDFNNIEEILNKELKQI